METVILATELVEALRADGVSCAPTGAVGPNVVKFLRNIQKSMQAYAWGVDYLSARVGKAIADAAKAGIEEKLS